MRPAAMWLLLAATAWAAPQADPGARWIWFESRETGTPPKLELAAADGSVTEVAADADTVLISYLADRPFGGLKSLSVSLGDTNRALLRFPVGGGAPLARATLVLVMKLSAMPPLAPFGLAVHEVAGAWTEAEACWSKAPASGGEPAARVTLEPREQTVRIDVTASVNRGRAAPEANHGWLLKSAGPPFDLGRALLEAIPWADSIAEARARAAAEDKAVLAVVRATYRPEEPCFTEQTLLAVGFADPDVRALVVSRCVPVRVAITPHQHLFPSKGGDPLDALGTDAGAVKPLALVVADGRGRRLGTLQGLGTFAPDLIHAFLRGAIPEAASRVRDPKEMLARGEIARARAAYLAMSSHNGPLGVGRTALLAADHDGALRAVAPVIGAPAPWSARARTIQGIALMRLGRFAEARQALEDAGDAEDPRVAAERAYWLGCLRHRYGDRDAAREAFTAAAADDPAAPFALKAKARLLWPDRMATEERLTAVPLAPGADTTESACAAAAARTLVDHAVDWLLDQQRDDGTWPNLQMAEYDGAVTALVARALLLLEPKPAGGAAARVHSAVAKASAWLARWVDEADPETANSFSAAYALDFLVDRAGRDAEAKADAQQAVRLLEGGQCPDGAWSYSRRFGTTWKGGFGGWPATERGRTHSMNTGLSLLALARAKAAGLRVDAEALERGARALLAMRRAPGAFTYTWPEPVNFDAPETSLGRAALCEHALLLLGKTKREDLAAALDLFMRGRAGLRKPVKLTESWVPPAAASSYFYAFAYHHAARALAHLGGETSRSRLADLRSDLLQVVEADRTWVDFDQIGKPYATAMALSVLSLAPPPR